MTCLCVRHLDRHWLLGQWEGAGETLLLGDLRNSLSGDLKVARALNGCPLRAVWVSNGGSLLSTDFVVRQFLKDLRKSLACEMR